MNFFALFQTILYTISTALLVPVVVLLIILCLWLFLYTGGFFGEWIKRRQKRSKTPLSTFLEEISRGRTLPQEVQSMLPAHISAYAGDLENILKSPGILKAEKIEDLNQKKQHALLKSVDKIRIVVRTGPSLGLMGTLIPMGTGLSGLTQGNMAQLSSSLILAFTTTVVDIVPIPGLLLQRPRIDVLIQASGLFRDSYAKLIKLMDRAVGMASKLKDVENFVAVHNQAIEAALIENGYSPKEAKNLSRARVFAPMPGAYSHAMQELIPNSGVWENEKEIADVFIHHYSYAYGNNMWGKSLKSAYLSNLKDVKMAMHTTSSNVYNLLDNDDVFAFLGGLSLAVKQQTGSFPETVVADMKDGKTVTLDDLPKAIGKALRTRYLNPKWIEGMKQQGYFGARAMDEFVENLWGFQVTSPWAVDGNYWEQIHDVYVQDKYGENLKDFFDKNNPWAIQSITARMLEADRKKYWQAPEKMKKNISRTFAVNVIEKGVACCEHTCNNPMFQQYVSNYLSLAGLLTPKQMDAFKMALAKAAGKPLEDSIVAHKKARQGLEKIIKEIEQPENTSANTQEKNIQGFEMVEEKAPQTTVTTSGSAWQVMAIAAGILVLLIAGYKLNRI